MSDIVFTPFNKQAEMLSSKKRIIGALAGKRGGKTQCGAIWAGMKMEDKSNYDYGGVDPYLGAIIAPTRDMLARLSWKKFTSYWKHFITFEKATPHTMHWHDHDPETGNESIILGLSGDKPSSIEGLKLHWAWIDEIFLCKEQLYLEVLARLSDTKGFLLVTGSLGVQHINPKNHFIYKYLKEIPDQETAVFEWGTEENPYFPRDELERQKKILDKKTYQSMFCLTWDVTPTSAVYEEFDEDNLIDNYKVNPDLPIYCSIDWGWTHPMAVGFYQHDKENDMVYLFDEIVESKLTLDSLYAKIVSKDWVQVEPGENVIMTNKGTKELFHFDRITNITDWCCDSAGLQTRELIGTSNIRHMKEMYEIQFRKKKGSLLKGVSLVRSYIKNAKGESRLKIDKNNCPKHIAGIKGYRYPEKNGIIINENPLKEDDDECDSMRYFFVNFLANPNPTRSSVIKF